MTFQGIEPGLPQWEFEIITTVLPIIAVWQFLQFIYSHYPSPVPWTYFSLHSLHKTFCLPLHTPTFSHYVDRETCLTNKEAATPGSWLMRCSPPALGFSCEQSADALHNRCSQNINIKTLFGCFSACNFIEKRFQHRCFPVNIAKCLKTAFSIEHLWWLFLFLEVFFSNSWIIPEGVKTSAAVKKSCIYFIRRNSQ